MKDVLLQRAQLLQEQKKFIQAKKILEDLFIQYPNDVGVLVCFAEVCLELDEVQKAKNFVNQAVGIEPENHYLYYLKSHISLNKEQYDEAEKSILFAIQSAPYVADYFAFYSNILLHRKKINKALEYANKALELDAENLLALNVRSTSLLKQNRSPESFKTIEDALKEDPNNAFTHTNYGWNLLESKNYNESLFHFREALKINPNFEYAQVGMLEALKSKFIFYRWFLQYSFWIGNFSKQNQWGIIIGFYILFRVLNKLSNSVEMLRPILTPILFLLFLVAFSTWVINPISNLFLRFNKFGKHLLSPKEKLSSNFVAVSLCFFIIGGVSYFFTNSNFSIGLSVFGFSMMLPLSVMFNSTKPKNILVFYTLGLFLLGAASLGFTYLSGVLFNKFSNLYVFAFIAFQWVANFLFIEKDNP